MGTKRLVYGSFLAAIAVVLMVSVSLPIMPQASYLRYDPSDVPILLSAVLIGPIDSVYAALVKDLLYFVVRAKGPFGPISDFIAVAVFAFVTGAVYRRFSSMSLKALVTSCALGVLARTLIMIPANLVILRLQFGFSYGKILQMMWPILTTFNVLKGGINAALTVVLLLSLPSGCGIRNRHCRS